MRSQDDLFGICGLPGLIFGARLRVTGTVLFSVRSPGKPGVELLRAVVLLHAVMCPADPGQRNLG
jgi:hypothetical protein